MLDKGRKLMQMAEQHDEISTLLQSDAGGIIPSKVTMQDVSVPTLSLHFVLVPADSACLDTTCSRTGV